MKKPLTKNVVCLLAVSALSPMQGAAAQTTASCLPSPSTVDCDEPTVAAGTSSTIIPTFPDPSPTCEIVTNACSFDFAVPVATQQEWSSFLQSAFVNTQGSCASLSPCAVVINGACGSDNGQSLSSPPTNLCNAGMPSAVSGNNPWSWTCGGIDGGASASCSTSGASCAAVWFVPGVVTPISGISLPPSVKFAVPDRHSDISPIPPDTPNGAEAIGRFSYGGGNVCGNHNIYATFTCENGVFVPNPQTISYLVLRTLGGGHPGFPRSCGEYWSTATIP